MKKGFQLISEREKLLLSHARAVPYRTLDGGGSLSIYFYLPKDFEEGPKRPVFLFFNGGAWDRGSVAQFAPHALYFVERGAVCGLVEYRNASSHPGSRPTGALQDGIAAISYVRDNAESLHIDGDRLVVVGAAAGANIAACTAMGALVSTGTGETEVSSSGKGALNAFPPAAAILISAIIDVRKGGYGFDRMTDSAEARLLSLSRYIDSGIPPMLLIHGTADRRVSHEDVADFAAKLVKRRCPCEYAGFEGRDENFFNLNVDPASYEACLAEMDRFLESHGILEIGGDHEGPHLISWRENDY